VGVSGGAFILTCTLIKSEEAYMSLQARFDRIEVGDNVRIGGVYINAETGEITGTVEGYIPEHIETTEDLEVFFDRVSTTQYEVDAMRRRLADTVAHMNTLIADKQATIEYLVERWGEEARDVAKASLVAGKTYEGIHASIAFRKKNASLKVTDADKFMETVGNAIPEAVKVVCTPLISKLPKHIEALALMNAEYAESIGLAVQPASEVATLKIGDSKIDVS
jgi:hypothetical protein